MTPMGVALATSFGPGRIEVQQRAVASWQRLGFEVLAVNGAAELSHLQGLFPTVRFVPASRDASAFLGRPYVFIRDLAIAAGESGAAIAGIINADIELEGGASLAADLGERARGALLFGSRVDYSDGRRDEGVVYRLGYDFFFFDATLGRDLPNEPYCMGAPWWDYWLPAVCLERGLPLRRVTSRIAFHELHAAAYNHELWMMYAGLMTPHLERIDLRPSLAPQARHAVRDIGKRTIRIARQFGEYLDRAAEVITIPGTPA